eukprot:7232791-Prorocentrum_lima.AAC.1
MRSACRVSASQPCKGSWRRGSHLRSELGDRSTPSTCRGLGSALAPSAPSGAKSLSSPSGDSHEDSRDDGGSRRSERAACCKAAEEHSAVGGEESAPGASI